MKNHVQTDKLHPKLISKIYETYYYFTFAVPRNRHFGVQSESVIGFVGSIEAHEMSTASLRLSGKAARERS